MSDADLSCQAGQPTHDFCLGVKLALYKDCDVDDYRRGICDHYLSNFPMVGTEPCCARKVVEQALQYAQGLGFAPHPDCIKGRTSLWRTASAAVFVTAVLKIG